MPAEIGRVRRPRRIVLLVVGIIVAILLFVAIWVGVRGLQARQQLADAAPLAKSIETSAIAGKTSLVRSDLRILDQKSAKAQSLTSDPIWRAAEIIPWVGPNLTAVRQSAALVHEVATDGIPPLVTLSSTISLHDLVPHNGAFDLAVFAKARPALDDARSALDRAKTHAAAIHSGATIAPVASAARQLVNLVESTASTVDGMDAAAKLLPTMLGGDGPRNYLLLSLNSAELRTPGGIPGAIAVVHAQNGALSLDQRTSATALGRAAEPVLPLTKSEKVLYDERLGTYMQNVVSTPNFERSGELAQAMWKLKTGETIDGVVAIDPIALGYILSATGPVNVGSGVTLDSSNAAKFLLSTVYAQIPDTTAQDEFFAGATRSVFAVLTSGKLDSTKLLDALSRSAGENRIHIWSAHPAEESKLSGSTLAGALPKSNSASTAFGVYFNDATGAKMDVYLKSSIGVAAAVCRSDDRPNYDVTVNLKLAAPLDAATSLPSYVTGRYAFGVKPGRVRTNVYVYAPPGSQPFSVTIGGKEVAFASAPLDGHPVVGAVVEMGPGESSTLVFKFVGKAGDAKSIVLQHTPMYAPVTTNTAQRLNCAHP
jgi:hypothetical protein